MKIKLLLFLCIFFSSSSFAEQYILVDLSEQMAYAIENESIMFEGRISSGKIGRETPEGEYTILQKKRMHRSNLWPKPKGGAKMPYMMRLSNDGIAMHLGYVPKRAASHGCIRLTNGFSQKMYAWAKVGTKVLVEGDASEYGHKISYDYDDTYSIVDFHD